MGSAYIIFSRVLFQKSTATRNFRVFIKRLIVFFILEAVVVCSYAQQKTLDKRISLDYTAIRLDALLSIIGEKTGSRFMYATEQIPVGKMISIYVKDKKLNEILDELFETTDIVYSEQAGQVLLRLRPKINKKFTISGYVYEKGSGEAIINVSIYLDSLRKGTLSNAYGFYSFTLPEGNYNVHIRRMGYTPLVKKIMLNENVKLNIQLAPVSDTLKEVTITPSTSAEGEFSSFLQESLDPSSSQLKNMPYLGAEEDILKVILLLPGVKRNADGVSSMSVRGGEADQNYITIDEAPVYNVSHMFGYFSVFNNDIVKDAALIKNGFSANYGGGLSSVIDVKLKEGDMQKFSTSGSMGLVSSRLTLQGPIIKDAMSFIISGRESHIDKLFRLYKNKENHLPYTFFDLNGKFNYKITARDRVYASAYFGNDAYTSSKSRVDKLYFYPDFKLGNFTNTLRWNHLFRNAKLFSNTSFIYTRFKYVEKVDYYKKAVSIGSGIHDIGLKADFNYYKNPESYFSFGVGLISHLFKPSITSLNISNIELEQKLNLVSNEAALFCFHDYIYNVRWKVNYGLRLNIVHSSNNTYAGLEPRVMITRSLNTKQNFKISYTRMRQSMHLIPSNDVNFPVDVWYPVTKIVKPKMADQLTANYTHKLPVLKSLLTFGTYYVKMQNLLEIKESDNFIELDNLEKELTTGRGDAYGLECTIECTIKKITGFLSYTLSKSTRQFKEVNEGKTYPATADRRHNFSLLTSYVITRNWSMSVLWIYATGSRFTPISEGFLVSNATMTPYNVIPVSGAKNSATIPPSHRLDINFVWRTTGKQKWKSEWHIGAYNVYNRTQPDFVTLTAIAPGEYRYLAKGLFGFFPAIAYKFNF